MTVNQDGEAGHVSSPALSELSRCSEVLEVRQTLTLLFTMADRKCATVSDFM